MIIFTYINSINIKLFKKLIIKLLLEPYLEIYLYSYLYLNSIKILDIKPGFHYIIIKFNEGNIYNNIKSIDVNSKKKRKIEENKTVKLYMTQYYNYDLTFLYKFRFLIKKTIF